MKFFFSRRPQGVLLEGKSLHNHKYRTRHSIHLIWCSISSMSHCLDDLFFTPLRDFTGRNFLDNHNDRTRHSIHLIGCFFSSLAYSLEAKFFCLFFLFPQRVLLNEFFFENHSCRTSQNIHQRKIEHRIKRIRFEFVVLFYDIDSRPDNY